MESVFSIYLSNDEGVLGDISFGGYDLDKFARKGSKDIKWVDTASNEMYWTSNLQGVAFG